MLHFYIFLLGLIVGSFANVVIYRVPREQSIIGGRSKCPDCAKRLAWYDLIPIVSFLILKRRCRNCKALIFWTYPLVELYSGLIFPVSYQLFSPDGLVNWLFIVFILELLLILALIDFENLILPDSVMLVMFLGILGYGVLGYLFGSQSFNIFSFNNFIGAAILFSALFLLWFLSKGIWLGLGDSKLAGIIGLIFGFWGGLIIFYGAIIVGTIVGLVLLVSRQANLKTKLPLGTLISLSATVYIFLGATIQNKLADFFYFVPLILK